MRLTEAQVEALVILKAMDGQPVGAWKRSSVYEDGKITRLNNNAVSNLCRMRLARRIASPLHSVYTANDKFVITDEGRRWPE